VRGEEWKSFDFSTFDVVLHVAGIAHVSNNKKNNDLYYKINRDLAIEVAQKAKNSFVNQFILMSSIIIYGDDWNLNLNIDLNLFNPINAYGKSKLEADLTIQNFMDENFNVLVLRSPVIYGLGCKGNFPKLQAIAKLNKFIPTIQNQKSMLHIDNLCEFIKQSILINLTGVCYPQNSEYISTSTIMILTRQYLGLKVVNISFLNPIILLLTKKSKYFRKIYGNKTYDMNVSIYEKFKYHVISTNDSIKKSL
jgi:nucleoside-diphosphate-sugar epimerase